jgi:hypothetical protein
MGPITTLQILIFSSIFCLNQQEIESPAESGSSDRLFGDFAEHGRTSYVATSLAAIMFYKWNWEAKAASARRRALMWALLLVVVFAMLGMLRMGVFNPFFLVLYLFLEPLFTSISAFSVMQGEEWLLFDVPKDFFYAFLNIVPTWLAG